MSQILINAVTGHLENEPELSGLVRHRFSRRNRIRRFVVLLTSEKTERFVRVSFVRQSGFILPNPDRSTEERG